MRVCFLLCLLLLSHTVFSAELYRYQDADGRWVFGDKKSLGSQADGSQMAEKIIISDARVKARKPMLFKEHDSTVQQGVRWQWRLTNPLPVTIQHWLLLKEKKQLLTSVMAKPFEEVILKPSDFSIDDIHQVIEHVYVLGELIEKPSMQVIPPPFLTAKRFRISQGFNGQYSHSGQGNRFAVDLAMAIGESVTAVRSGIIADARDDFSIGGAAEYFLDKANHVTVMHEDGSYAVYAHILYGSLEVEVGDRIEQGQVLARIGNTGYSTGPHLHFVLRYNSGKGGYSIPFKFETDNGIQAPVEGQFIQFN